MGITKTKIIEGTFVEEEDRNVPYEVMGQIIPNSFFVKQPYCIFETEEGEKSFPKCVIPKSNFEKGDKVKIEQKYFWVFKTSERVIS